MTGWYPNRVAAAFEHDDHHTIPTEEEIFLPEILDDDGYATKAIGKWYLAGSGEQAIDGGGDGNGFGSFGIENPGVMPIGRGFEGCEEQQGCRPGTCTHVWNYAQSLARVFPSLEREMRRIDVEESTDDGFTWFRTPLSFGSELALHWRDERPAADGQMGTVV